jgi:hypothetical protein
LGTAALIVFGATGGTGRLTVRFRPAKGHSVAALLRSKASADLPGVDMIEADARDEGTLTCSLVVKGAENARLMHDRRPSCRCCVSDSGEKIAENNSWPSHYGIGT